MVGRNANDDQPADADHARPDVTTALRLARRRVKDMAADQDADVEDRIEELGELLWALDRIGDRSAVLLLAQRLIGVVADIDQDVESASWHLREIVQVLAGVGLLDQAEDLVAAIRYQRDRSEAQSLLVRMLASKADFRRAEQVVEAVADADLRSTALIELVQPLDEAGDHAGARRAARRAEEAVDAVAGPGDQPGLLNHLVQVLLSGDHEAEARRIAVRAEEVALTLTDPHDRDWGHSSAVHALALTGQFDRAERLVPAVLDRSPRESALLKLAFQVAAAGDVDRGLRLAAGITATDTRSAAQYQLVSLLAESGDVERAESIAAAIASPSSRSAALSDLAGALAAAGDRTEARRVVREAERAIATITYPATRSLARRHLVDVLIDVGDFEQAEITALTQVEGDDSGADLEPLARAMAEAGDRAGARRVLSRAEPIARAITEPESRSWALSSLADALLAVGAMDDAVRTVVEATRVGAWYRTLLTVAALEPDAVRAVAEDVLADNLASAATDVRSSTLRTPIQ